MSKPVVHLYTLCWDEADMLGFFFRHYDPWIDRYVVYDDGSTDGSLDILRSHPKVALCRFGRTEADSFVLSHRALQNEVWKESRGQADWVVVTAIDEHLWVRGHAMADYLADQQRIGVTLIPALGFDMNAAVMPPDQGLLVDAVTHGRPRTAFNKLSIFDPNALQETGFASGRHSAEPVGHLRLPARDEVVLWHYKHLGFERNAEREAAQALRLGTVDLDQGLGKHYLRTRHQLRQFWDEMEQQSGELGAGHIAPDRACLGPLWWRGHPDMLSVAPVPAAVAVAPTVSVLVKSFNHAPYVQQTIQSVLTQSFQNFEIVVTDDGSTDSTLDLLRGFTDPRVRVNAFERNHGISAAMNATIARARGRYLAILNSDDWALPDRLQRQVAFLDAHPDISLLFGLPQAVDESGKPTTPFNDFEAPLRFPDFSRRTWLRHFFYYGNCLCAPTAMIRREAYRLVGPYDLRLTNLQDFDMWLRMLIAGQTIHVLAEPLTAFRIRDQQANMSAPRPDVVLRSAFEQSKILRRFADFGDNLFAEVFGADCGDWPDLPISVQLAELAARVPRKAYQHFAVELLHEVACQPEALRRLHLLSGTLDTFGIQAIDRLAEHLAKARSLTARLREEQASLQAEHLAEVQSLVAKFQEGHASLQAENTLMRDQLAYQLSVINELRISRALNRDEELMHWQRRCAALERSMSWRVTQPMRIITSRMPKSLRRILRSG